MVGRAGWQTGRTTWAYVVSIGFGYCYGAIVCGISSMDVNHHGHSQAENDGAIKEHNGKKEIRSDIRRKSDVELGKRVTASLHGREGLEMSRTMVLFICAHRSMSQTALAVIGPLR